VVLVYAVTFIDSAFHIDDPAGAVFCTCLWCSGNNGAVSTSGGLFTGGDADLPVFKLLNAPEHGADLVVMLKY
jgi:hypothetical protein